MTSFTFVHAADLHLDAPFRGVSTLIAPEGAAPAGSGAPVPGFVRAGDAGRLADFLQNATFAALDRLTRLCLDLRVDFLLLAGDVYNSADSSLRARLALRDSFLQLEKAGITVFLAHGNHDPLGAETSAVPWPANVTVFGKEPGACPAVRAGVPLALVHGISHTAADEKRNLARLFRRAGDAGPAALYQIGLLHCAVSGRSGAHASYAPCSFGDLEAAGLDYWALGHVHGLQMMRPEAASERYAPLAAYSGSLQGLHINEQGPHGCLVIRVEDGRGRAEFAPLAPVQWESLDVRLDEADNAPEDLPELLVVLRDALDGLAAGVDASARSFALGQRPDLLISRLRLSGRSVLDAELRKTGALETLRAHLNRDLEGSGLLLRDIVLETRPLEDEQALLLREDLAGEALRVAKRLRGEPGELKAFAEETLGPLFNRSGIRQTVPFPENEELAGLIDEAGLLCRNLLEGE